MPKKPKHPKNPVAYNCANPACGRSLVLSGYGGLHPREDTPEDHIHRIVSFDIPGFTLLCTCGHYTVVAAHHPPYGRTKET